MNRSLNFFLALLRIAAGLSLLMSGVAKVGWFSSSTALHQRLTEWSQAAPYAFVAGYDRAMLAHAGWLARVVVLGELGLGALLLLGFLTPVAALLAFVMVSQFQLASGQMFTKAYLYGQSGLVYLLTYLVLFAGRAGQSLGLDGFIGRSLQGGGGGGGPKR
jgi:uncharacterized membrane protein YphA (DoxX/SURF4 family)